MNCPQEIADVVLNIIRYGILNVRAAAWGNDVERCECEADHIHNLPDLLLEYSRKKLDYYWDIERTCYLKAMKVQSVGVFDGFWKQLKQVVPDLKGEEEIARTRKEPYLV